MGVEARDVAPWKVVREDGSLDDNAFVRDVGNERAPILRYDALHGSSVSRSDGVSDFVEKHWRAQYPTISTVAVSSFFLEAFRKLLSESPSENLLVNGHPCTTAEGRGGPLCNTYSWAASGLDLVYWTRGLG